ncbi:MAG: SGNH/GDSL hydrolase family protein [Burkholderiales bacterium]|nr:SGNH/GDSL hydrolase family protein [Opitutaceae bacterium]
MKYFRLLFFILLAVAQATHAQVTIPWTDVAKTGSSLADFATRSASDLNSGTLPAARLPALTGDVATSAGSAVAVLATVNSNVGSWGSATTAPTFTVDAKGRITAAGSAAIAPPWSAITSKPTTRAGFGLTDAAAVDLSDAAQAYVLQSGDWGLVQGREHLATFIAKVSTRTAAKIVFTGDSTIAGDGTTSPYRLNEIVENAAAALGYNAITTVNNGHSGANTQSWNTTYLAGDLSENPDLMVCGWGLNDPTGVNTDQQNADLTVARYVTALTTIRAARTPAQMSILVLVPNRCQDDAAWRTAGYSKAVRKGLQALVPTYKFALIDTPQMLRDPSVGGWINEDYSVGSNRYVHPTNTGNVIRAGVLIDAIFPQSLAVAAQSAGIPNTVYPTGSKIGSDLPSVYPRGMSIYPATTTGSGTVFPYQGWVITTVHASGYTRQTNIFADITPSESPVGQMAERTGYASGGWGAWYHPGLATASSAGLAAALSDETGTGAAVFGTGATLGGLTTTNRIVRTGGVSLAAWGGNGIFLNVVGNTVTDTSTAASGTAAYTGFSTFHPPILAATNTGVTGTIASTVYIGGAPSAGTNVTLTNAYALHVDAGVVKIDEGLAAGTINGNTITQGTGTLTLGAGQTLAVPTGGTLGTAAYTAATAYLPSFVGVPASAGAAGTAGTVSYDGSFIYICTATNTWKRVAIATW